MINAGIFGATGYAGQQLFSLLSLHPEVSVSFISSNTYAGMRYDKVYPHFTGIFDGTLISMTEAMNQIHNVDVVFTALPHGGAFEIAKIAIPQGVKLIDLGADFRIEDFNVYENWYKVEHRAKELIPQAAYGLPELWKSKIEKSNLIANPGCYTTASILAVSPLLSIPGLIDPDSIIIDAKSGVTGAGRKGEVSLLLAEAEESMKAYSIGNHRHTPEIEQELSKVCGKPITINFTPHLIPMKRGIFATCYAKLSSNVGVEELYELYENFYKDAPFVRIRHEALETRYVRYSNYCDISIVCDLRTNRVIVTSTIDNLVKGAAGQAVQNMNIVFGLEETAGLANFLPIAP